MKILSAQIYLYSLRKLIISKEQNFSINHKLEKVRLFKAIVNDIFNVLF